MANAHDSSAHDQGSKTPKLSDEGFFLQVAGRDGEGDRLCNIGIGDYLAVEPSRQPVPGSLVLTILEDGRALLATPVDAGGRAELQPQGHLLVVPHQVPIGVTGVVVGRWVPEGLP